MSVKTKLHLDNPGQIMANGVRKLAIAVGSTLGPGGRPVAIENQYGATIITKDGVTVAKNVQLDDVVENMGAQIVVEVANKTAQEAGDGTTTGTILADAIVQAAIAEISNGQNPVELKRGMDMALSHAVSILDDVAIKVTNNTELAQVATISANNDSSIGDIIAAAFDIVGKDGLITVQESHTWETSLKNVDGTSFNRGYLSQHFVTNQEKQTVEFVKPLILVTDRPISSVNEIKGLLELAHRSNRQFLIICDDVAPEPLSVMVINRLQGALKICAVKAPSFGESRRELLTDVSILTGATFVSKDSTLGLDDLTIDDFGSADKVVISKNETVIIGGAGDSNAVSAHADYIREQIHVAKSDFEREKVHERLARFLGSIVIIEVGAGSEIELKEKKDRFDDALHATRAAIHEGFAPGGGTTLARVSNKLVTPSREDVAHPSNIVGFEIVKQALNAPLNRIIDNIGCTGTEFEIQVKDAILSGDTIGYDARRREANIDMIDAGIIDPIKVTKTALRNAVSVASTLITTQAVISVVKDSPSSLSTANDYGYGQEDV